MTLEKVRLSEKGPLVSPIVTGVWRWHEVSDAQRDGLIRGSIDAGFSTFDHADIYGGYTVEALFGKSLKTDPSLRDHMQLVSKCGIKLLHENRPAHSIKHYDTSKAHIKGSVEKSLENLHTDHLDLLLIHRPDPLMDADEIAETFAQLKAEGKVLHFGVSNFTPAQFELLNARFPLVTNQVEISVLKLDTFLDGTLELAQQLRTRPMAYSPLGSGAVFQASENEQVQRVQQVANELCEKHQVKLDTLLLAWLLKHPSGMVPILGTTKTERFATAKAALSLQLDKEDWFKLWTASTGTRVP